MPLSHLSLGSSHFVRHYSGNLIRFLFLRLLRCFSSPGILSQARAWVLPRQVTPLGNPRLGLLDSSPRLIAVMPRPSSATDTKASALCPFLFDLHQPEHKT